LQRVGNALHYSFEIRKEACETSGRVMSGLETPAFKVNVLPITGYECPEEEYM
jgi:hypothetical protein